MPRTRAHLRSSRRVPSLKDSEIDHEINIFDRVEDAEDADAGSRTPEPQSATDRPTSSQYLVPPQIRVPPADLPKTDDAPSPSDAGPSGGQEDASRISVGDGNAPASIGGKGQASTEDEGPERTSSSTIRPGRRQPAKEPETAIDILYENQRGGFLCGIPLFSSAALGNLDPAPWTNFAHKTSPTDIYTAQVPDPSWEWAWPEWRVNHDDTIGADEDGWEYSFMFSKKFSWHGPSWYNSFVRRRAWIRRRIKKGLGYQANDPHLMSPEYFSVTPSRGRQRSRSRGTDGAEGESVGQQKSTRSQDTVRRSRDSRRGDVDAASVKADITTVDELLSELRNTRIDREKLEAVGNYIEHCSDDLDQLPGSVHDIMSSFVFQASRRLLLARLTQMHDEVERIEKLQEMQEPRPQTQQEEKGKSPATAPRDEQQKGDGAEGQQQKLKQQKRRENLVEAVKQADEEVRRLEYWSDIKGMAQSGESCGAVDSGKGWEDGWRGLDKSGPRGVRDEGDPLPR
ncbi:hypothetical protein GGS23DRAFT_267327 [Durotheca rogersii]|uniref:uncharacterized protein n=1 Tax=Durotheca rogersii TaxID=419775 RepID=UPI00221EEBB7|nr:uncharacterized protein GGS23DRAFT_267327 [Durotheca rogersii]KAI5859720.1 hypothetical protein GGS23DRAFT_267327 [Durotheca rogersii]